MDTQVEEHDGTSMEYVVIQQVGEDRRVKQEQTDDSEDTMEEEEDDMAQEREDIQRMKQVMIVNRPDEGGMEESLIEYEGEEEGEEEDEKS